jgi:SAM-dependent methyltransferase
MLERMEGNRVRLYVKVQELKEELARLAPSDVLTGPHPLEVFRIPDKNTFLHTWGLRLRPAINDQQKKLPATSVAFELPGYCVVCGKSVSLRTDFEFAAPDENGRLIPAWRERQLCQCRLNCRLRSSFHFLKDLLGLDRNAVVYATEQQTALFPQIRVAFPHAIGSENLGHAIPLGRCNQNGIRNENPARLTFADAVLDCVFSLDRLQCVPDYRAALKEMARCLRPGGHLLLTVPFRFDLDQSVVRAELDASGNSMHHQPPVYHYDPVNSKGSLCFHDFGWDLLATIEQGGFAKAELLAFTAPHFGYVGMQYVIHAIRAAKPAAGLIHAILLESENVSHVSGRAEECAAA